MIGQVNKKNAAEIQNIESYLESHQKKSLLRVVTCGSVDDGKSTLIGRLLYDSRVIFEDQLAQLEADSKKLGTQDKKIDFALLVDGLASEREQGITIDVAYRFFSTEKRKFILADTPGHEQYTRNMVTGASTAELAIVLIDARKGVLPQTRRHSFLCHLLGIRKIVLAVNKMDLVNYDEAIFKSILDDYTEFTKSVGIEKVVAIPISGLNGDNIVAYSNTTVSWYSGPTLISYLESVELEQNVQVKQDFLLPVQWVNRPNSNFRGFSGKVAAGVIKPSDKVRIVPSGKTSLIERIVTFDGDLAQAAVGQSVTLTLANEVDCSRGQVITTSATLGVANQFKTTLVWMDENALVPGRSYFLKIGSQTVSVTLAKPSYQININTMEHMAVKELLLNEIAVVDITTDRPIPFLPYAESRELGGFILIDKMTNATVGAGLINFALRRTQNIHWQPLDVTRDLRASLKNQKPALLWMTGLSGSGKTTIANAVEKKLAQINLHTFLLDGDNVRHGLNKDLGFTDADRIENIRRVGEVSKLMIDAGLIVITAFISPFRDERKMVRELVGKGEFIEVFIDTPLSIAEERDVKGLYKKARSGQLKNFTGIDSPYEAPESPELHIDTSTMSIEAAATKIVKFLLGFQK